METVTTGASAGSAAKQAKASGPAKRGTRQEESSRGSAREMAAVGKTVTKKDLIDRIADRTRIKRQDVKVTVQEFLDQVVAELQAGNRLEFRDFGVFEIKARAPRVAQNPKTLERVDVPAKRTVKFKIGRLMRECLEVGGGSPNGTNHGGTNGTTNGAGDANHAMAAAPGLRLRSPQ